MRPIPKGLAAEMQADPFYKQCCITGATNEKIEWHHNLIYGGRQVNRKFCILPLAQSVHDRIVVYKELCDWIMLNRATPEELVEFSKATNYKHRLAFLNKKYGTWTPDWYKAKRDTDSGRHL